MLMTAQKTRINRLKTIKMEGKKSVYTTTEEYNAVLVQGALEAAGIEVVLLNQRDSTSNTFGQYELFVLPAQYEKALGLIEQNNS